MIDESLLKSNFIGRDGFRWWIGQIPPAKSMGKQVSGGGWGNRFKVRILGYHPYDDTQLPNEDLPWAQCLVPTTAGSGAANCATGVQVQPGDIVLGFFLDGDNGQIPIILAVFGRTDQVSSKEYGSPFEAFTGYDKKINDPNPGIQKSESNEKTAQPTPRNVSPEQAAKLNEIAISNTVGSRIILADPSGNNKVSIIQSEISNLLGKVGQFADSAFKVREEIRKTIDTITALSNDFVGIGFNYLFKQLESILGKGLDLLYEVVFDKVFAIVFAATPGEYSVRVAVATAAAHAAGVAAQTAMVQPVKILEESISKVANKIVRDNVKSIVTDMVNSTIGNIDKFTRPVEEQFSATLLNSIIDTIEVGLSGPIAGVEKLLQFFPSFSTGNILRSSVDAIKSVAAAFDTNQAKGSFKGTGKEWRVGMEPMDARADAFKKILELINLQKSGSKSTELRLKKSDADKKSINLGELYNTVTLMLPVDKNDKEFVLLNVDGITEESVLTPKVKRKNEKDGEINEMILVKSVNAEKKQIKVKRGYFGDKESYAINQEFYVFNSKVKDPKNKNNEISIVEYIEKYGKAISAIKTKRETYAPPPTVRIFGGGTGSGATAVPLMGGFTTNPDGVRTGSIIGFQITNPGSDYTIPPFVEIVDDEDSPQGYGAIARSVVRDGKVVAIYIISEGENYSVSTVNDKVEYIVKEIFIDETGSDYSKGDTVEDDFGNTYPIEVLNGRIIKVSTLNNNIVNDKPIFRAVSETGSGAVFHAILEIPDSIQQGMDETQKVTNRGVGITTTQGGRIVKVKKVKDCPT